SCRSPLPHSVAADTLLRDVDAQLDAARAPDRGAAEECTLQQIFLVEEVINIQFRSNQRAAHSEGIADAHIRDVARAHMGSLVEVEQSRAVRAAAIRRLEPVRKTRSIRAGVAGVEVTRCIRRADRAGKPLIVVQIEVSLRRISREEAAGDGSLAIRMIEREVEVRREWTGWTEVLHGLEPGDANMGDVDRRDDRRTRHGVVIDAGRTLLVICRKLGYEPKWKAVDISRLVKVVPLRQRGCGNDALLRNTRDSAEILDVGRNEEPPIVQVECVARVREEVKPDAWAQLRLRSGERRSMRVVAHACPDFESLNWRVRGLGVSTDIVPLEIRIGRRTEHTGGRCSDKILMPRRVLAQCPELEFQLTRRMHGVVGLDAVRREITIFAQVVRIERIWKEHELRRVANARYVLQPAGSHEASNEQLRHARLRSSTAFDSGGRVSAENVTIADVDERIAITLTVIQYHVARRIIRNLETRRREARVEIEHVGCVRGVLHFRKPGVIISMVVKVDYPVARGIEHYGLQSHVSGLATA